VNKKKIFYSLLIFLFFSETVYSEVKKEPKNNNDTYVEEDGESPAVERFRKRDFELGIRYGLGYHPDDRFQSQLKNYKSESSSYVYSHTTLSSFHNTTNTEFLARIRLYENSKVGFVYGNTQFNRFHINEVTSVYTPNIYTATRLNFSIKVEYFFLMYYYEFKFKNFFVEAGMGMGVNTISWKTNGHVISEYEYTPQNGFMVGNGLGYKLELSINKKLIDQWVLQFGAFYNYYTAPSFSGTFNDNSGSFFIRSDGTVAPLSNSGFRDSIVDTNYASRQLDMRAGNIVFFVSTLFRFSL
jgi:hypothetical protein